MFSLLPPSSVVVRLHLHCNCSCSVTGTCTVTAPPTASGLARAPPRPARSTQRDGSASEGPDVSDDVADFLVAQPLLPRGHGRHLAHVRAALLDDHHEIVVGYAVHVGLV